MPSRNLQQSVYNNSQWILFHLQFGNFSFMPSGFLLQVIGCTVWDNQGVAGQVPETKSTAGSSDPLRGTIK